MLKKLACGLLIGGFVTVVSAQTLTNIQANTPYSAYLQDSSGTIVRSQSGLCWRTGFWTPADAVVGCDGVLAPPVTKAIAPAFVATPETAPTSPSVAAPVVAPLPAPIEKPTVVEKVNLSADSLFDSGKAELKPAGKRQLDDLAAKLKAIHLESIIAIGHTDSVGAAAYNQKLSVKRAEAVKTFLVSKGIEATRIHVEGKGKTKPIASNKTAAGRAKNRRVEIEIIGSKTK